MNMLRNVSFALAASTAVIGAVDSKAQTTVPPASAAAAKAEFKPAAMVIVHRPVTHELIINSYPVSTDMLNPAKSGSVVILVNCEKATIMIAGAVINTGETPIPMPVSARPSMAKSCLAFGESLGLGTK